MSEPSPDDVDRFLAELLKSRRDPLTREQIDTVLHRIRQGGVVRTSGVEDYVVVSFQGGRFRLDEFNRYHHRTTEVDEDAVRAMAATVDEFRMLLPARLA